MDKLSRKPGYEALRRFRSSAPGAEYFLTTNLERPSSGLESTDLTNEVQQQIFQLQTECLWTVRTFTIMPDHLHLLVALGDRVSLPACMQLLKGRATPKLRSCQLKWQEGYYDHRVRIQEDRLPIFLYIFLNPYRAKLVGLEQKWLGYYCDPEDWTWFGCMTDSEFPQPEWLV